VAKAVADLESQVSEMKAAQTEEALKDESAKALAAKDEEIKALQAQLDTTVLEAEKTKADLSALVAQIEEEKKAAEMAAEIAARREDRLAKVREVASFPEEYLTGNADRWAAMGDEDFEVLCTDYAAVSKPEEAGGETKVPVETAMQHERETSGKKDPLAATKAVLSGALHGVDYSTI
jgi:hypothetical protein